MINFTKFFIRRIILLAIFLAISNPDFVYSQISFAPKIDLRTGYGPTGVDIGDIDGDYKPDVVVADQASNTISIFKNNSTTGSFNSFSFGPRITITLNQPSYLKLIDIDGDSKLDIVVNQHNQNKIAIFKNQSTTGIINQNSFASPVILLTANGSYQIAVGDLNSDGKPDIVSANYSSSTISIFINISATGLINNSSFSNRLDIPTKSGPHGITLGDLNNDNLAEIVVVYFQGGLSILENISSSGNIIFNQRIDISNGSCDRGVGIEDLDSDGIKDIISADAFANRISIYKNNFNNGLLNASTFSAPIYLSTNSVPIHFTIADFDTDGKPDIANNNYSSGSVTLFRNISSSGSVLFQNSISYQAVGGVWNITSKDLDNDSNIDIVTTNENNTYGNTISVFKNTSISITLTYPSSSEVWLPNSIKTITWISSNVNSVNLDFSPDSGLTWTNIAFSVNASLGSYEFLVPNIQSEKCLIKISNTNNPNTFYISQSPIIVTQNTNTASLLTGLLHYYKFDGDLKDHITNTIAENTNTIDYSAGKINQARSFNGINATIKLGIDENLLGNNPNQWSFTYWVQFTSAALGKNCRVISNYYSPNGNIDNSFGILSGKNQFDKLDILIRPGNYTLTTSFNVSPGIWYHVGGTYNKNTSTMSLYVNGIMIGQSYFNPSYDYFDGAPLLLGAQIYQNVREAFHTGLIDEVGLWNKELTALEVSFLFNNGSGSQYPFFTEPQKYTINSLASYGGTISPNGNVTITHGSNQEFTITPNVGYHISDVLVDGSSVGAISSYTFNNVTSNHTITANFAIDVFTISATSNGNGTITPSGNVSVNYGENQTFTITPNVGYHISDVLVDGSSVGAVSSYTFNNVTSNHTITANFAVDLFTIVATAGTGGTITPTGTISVAYGSDQTFSFQPFPNYRILEVIVDNISLGIMQSYTFKNVMSNHTIEVKFYFEIALDIKPGSCPNPFNPKSNGVLPVAILGSNSFDVASINLTSLRLQNITPLRNSLEDVAKYFTPPLNNNECPEQGNDGIIDLTLKFDSKMIASVLGNYTVGESKLLKLTGKLQDGMEIRGQDYIKIVNNLAKDGNNIPRIFELSQNYPNPFNPTTKISYSIPKNSFVKLEIFNTLGEKIAALVNEEKEVGYYDIEWNANVSSGIYFYKIEAIPIEKPSEKFVQIKKMVLMK